MTEDEAYKVHIQHTFNAFCKVVIRHAAIDIILKLRRRWEREFSLDYLMNEKFVQLAEPEQLEEYLFYCLRPDRRSGTMRNLLPPLPSCRSRRRKKFPLLFPAPAAASDRRTYRPDTQHSGAAYPACLEAAPAVYGGENAMSKLLPYETIVKAHEGDPDAIDTVLSHYAGYIRYCSKVHGKVNTEVEEYVKQKLIAALFKFRFDR